MARPTDLVRRGELLDGVVTHLARHGLGHAALRPLAASLGISVNGLVHHLGPKEQIVAAALSRAGEQQAAILDRWLTREPHLTQADLLRRWWRWINASPDNLALVRLGIEAAAIDAAGTRLPGSLQVDQVTIWRTSIELRLVAEGWPPDEAVVEASLVKAVFTGLVVDLLATGQRRRLNRALEVALARLEANSQRHSWIAKGPDAGPWQVAASGPRTGRP